MRAFLINTLKTKRLESSPFKPQHLQALEKTQLSNNKKHYCRNLLVNGSHLSLTEHSVPILWGSEPSGFEIR